MKNHPELYVRSPVLFRFTAIGLGLFMLAMGTFAAYILWVDIVPLYGRLYRNALVVETSLKGFFMIGFIPLTPCLIVACTIAAWIGRKFDPPVKRSAGRTSASRWMAARCMSRRRTPA